MSYRILLVDDEPLILSGVKFLIDWEKNGCVVIGAARNGQQALEMMEQQHPDIVLCDINMPVLSGIEVLQACADKADAPVFIMLTNHEEFDLARQSMRYKAVDYLLKTQLEAETLERSLALAMQECARRGNLARVQKADEYILSNQTQLTAANAKKLFCAEEDNLPADCVAALVEQGVTQSFCFVQLMMDFSQLPALGTFTDAERAHLYEWEGEVIEKLAGNLFSHFAAFDPDGAKQSLVLLCWDVPGDITAPMELFYAKLCAASGNITQTRLCLLATQTLHGESALPSGARQLLAAREYYYRTQCSMAFYEKLPSYTPQPLEFESLANRLVLELRSKNVAQCVAVLDRAIASVTELPHQHADALQGCVALYSAAAMVIFPVLPPEESGEYFKQSAAMLRIIRRFSTQKEVLAWLLEFKRHIVEQLELLTSGKSDLVEKAKRYVQENVESHIMLQDVADHVNISPSYLSALFKKDYGQNFIDYINATKMQRACALIQDGHYRIYEVSYKLGFENAYYFTKVFKRHLGLTPTEYQRKVRGEEKDV